jgi:putative flippase GtrA
VIPGRIVRFALVGVLNTATYYGLYLLFGLFLPYLAAHVVAVVLSMIGSFFLSCYFTFRTRPTWRKFLLFPLSNATNFVVTTVGLYVLVQFFGLNQRIAPLLAASVAIPVTFVVAQMVLAGRHREPRPSGLPASAVGTANRP